MSKTYEHSTSNTLTAVGTYIKGKIPKVDGVVTETENAVSGAAVKAYVDSAVADVGGLSFKMVDSLPATGEGKYIYLVPKATTEQQDIYDEFIWYNSAWEHIGSTAVDLSGYVKAADMHEITADEVKTILDAVWG